MQRGDERRRLAGKQRERIVVEMEVQDIELLCLSTHALQHGHVQRVGVAHRAVETQRLRPHRLELCRRPGIPAREQRDVMAERDQLLGQPGDHPFGAAIQPGRNRLGQRRYLRNMHAKNPFRWSDQPGPQRPSCKSGSTRIPQRRTAHAVPWKPICRVVRCSTSGDAPALLQDVTIGEWGSLCSRSNANPRTGDRSFDGRSLPLRQSPVRIPRPLPRGVDRGPMRRSFCSACSPRSAAAVIDPIWRQVSGRYAGGTRAGATAYGSRSFSSCP